MLYSRTSVSPLFALLAIAVVIGVAKAKPPSRIYGGETANDNEYTAVIGLARPGEFQHWCGGALIGPRHVLTAGHCATDVQPKDIGVHAGIHDVLDTDIVVERLAEKIIIHDDYVPHIRGQQTVRNDIAILVLKEAFPIGGQITTLKLPTANPTVGESYTVAGWGLNNPNPTPENFQSKLKTLTMTVRDADVCNVSSPQMSCMFSNSGGICSGDSGSPFMKDGYIYGVSSTGDCAIGGQANVVNVYNYIDWINTTIRNNP